MMDNLQLSRIANTWYQNNPALRSGAFKDNTLFRMLYDAYCRRNGTGGSYDAVIRDGDYLQACSDLYAWYKNRYSAGFRMPSGTQGQKRTVTWNTTEYTFDLLYSDDRQFQNYLIGDIPQSGSQDLFSFVLHTAVAFLVPPRELDIVLQHLGFHPLHVKNIHHLAIYHVLLTAEHRTADSSFNPFDEVKKLYFRANGILQEQEEPQADSYCFGDQETRAIRNNLFLQKSLQSQNFENLIALNKNALNMRHSMILSDFHKLTSVFIHLFDSPRPSEGNDSEKLDEDYSFYVFVERFCKEDLSRKKYREQLTSMIDRNQKHPTRQVLILLWLYVYCFSCLKGVYIEKNTFSRISKQLKKHRPEWAAEAKAYYRNSYFDVYGFITGEQDRSIPSAFDGAAMIAYINEKLQLRYGWGPLNARLPFDYHILNLEQLAMQINDDYSAVRCKEVRYAGKLLDIRADLDNVPCPLAVIMQLLDQLKIVISRKNAQLRKAKLTNCPLKCSLYEQI